MAGYLRVGLHSDRIASLYQEGRWRLLLLGLHRARGGGRGGRLPAGRALAAGRHDCRRARGQSTAPGVDRSRGRVRPRAAQREPREERPGRGAAGKASVAASRWGRSPGSCRWVSWSRAASSQVDYVSARARELVRIRRRDGVPRRLGAPQAQAAAGVVGELHEPGRVPRAHPRGRAGAQRPGRAPQARGADRGLPRPAARPARSRGARGGRPPAASARRPRPRLSHPGPRAARAARSHDDQPRPAARDPGQGRRRGL